MTQSKLTAGQIHIGQPLQFDVYNLEGKLLLRRGIVIERAAQLEQLMALGLYREGTFNGDTPHAHEKTPLAVATSGHYHLVNKLSAFGMVRAITHDLGELLRQPLADTFQGNILSLAARLQHVCQLNADAVMATIQLMEDGRYGIRRMVHVAILAELISQTLQTPEEERKILLAAAMTSNMTMLDLQDALYAQKEKMTTEQMHVMLAHPVRGAEVLQELGVTDRLWLTAVRQHHETIDGKGYPGRLTGAEICREAQILNLCDRFTALCTGRAHRVAALPSAVLKDLFMERGKGLDSDLVGTLLKVTGLYPPGSLVRLANADIAVVVKRTMSNKQPVVKSVKTQRSSEPLEAPRKHLTSETAYAITALVSAAELGFAVNPDVLWDETFEFTVTPPQADSQGHG